MAGVIRVLLFGPAREAVGRSSLDWPVPASGSTLQEALRELGEAYPKLRPVVDRSRWVVNEHFVTDRATQLRAGDELAIHPPYSGG
jgi:molybdopterin converting factor small subunit